jgi:protein gp37
METQWVADIRDQCVEAGVPFFFKQWGGVFKKRHGRTLEGRTWDGMPDRFGQSKGPRVALAVV